MMQWGTRMAHGAQGRAGWMCARALAAACRAGGRGRTLGTGLDGHKPVQPARRSTAPGSSPARSSSAASQPPSERRPKALPPPLEQKAPWPSEKSQRLRREGRVS